MKQQFTSFFRNRAAAIEGLLSGDVGRRIQSPNNNSVYFRICGGHTQGKIIHAYGSRNETRVMVIRKDMGIYATSDYSEITIEICKAIRNAQFGKSKAKPDKPFCKIMQGLPRTSDCKRVHVWYGKCAHNWSRAWEDVEIWPEPSKVKNNTRRTKDKSRGDKHQWGMLMGWRPVKAKRNTNKWSTKGWRRRKDTVKTVELLGEWMFMKSSARRKHGTLKTADRNLKRRQQTWPRDAVEERFV